MNCEHCGKELTRQDIKVRLTHEETGVQTMLIFNGLLCPDKCCPIECCPPKEIGEDYIEEKLQ